MATYNTTVSLTWVSWNKNGAWRNAYVNGMVCVVMLLCSASASAELTGVVAGEAGEFHTCALTSAGGIKCWGFNLYGQLGDGSSSTRTTPVDATGLTSGAESVWTGANYTCARTSAGGIKCWGENGLGQLGDGSFTTRSTPIDVTGFTSGAEAGWAGYYHTCALTSAGGVKCWGYNTNGQIGDGSMTSRQTPVVVTGLTSGVEAGWAGWAHTCALTSAGGVKCWGYNNSGNLGDGSTTNRTTPVDVTGLTSGVVAGWAGDHHTCALTTAGGIKCWGYNNHGQLGDGSTTNRTTPVDVTGLTSGVEAGWAGVYHTCALTSAGAVKCWGYNDSGQLGDGSITQQSTPVDIAGLTSGVEAGWAAGSHTCALTSSGTVKCWGSNGFGQLGDGSTATRTSPTNVAGLSSSVEAGWAGSSHTCVLTTAGGIKCWGPNSYGQLGDGSVTQRNNPVDVIGLTSGVDTGWAGSSHTCAVTSAGGIKCWGSNTTGQLGDGSTTNRTTPINVTGLTSGVEIGWAGDGHTCALTSAGGIKCWGWNNYGQIGDGSTTQRTTPTDVTGLTSGVLAGWAGSSHTCVLTSAGGIKCWGRNNYGRLGDGSTANRATPVDVSGLTSGVEAGWAGSAHTCALTSAGGVKCWGANDYGQLGDGSTTSKTIPVDVAGLTSGVVAGWAGGSHTCALTSAGGIKCWGRNSISQLGDGSNMDRITPVDVAGITTGVVAGWAGGSHTCALTSAGAIKCWGNSLNGQLGDDFELSIRTVLRGMGAQGLVNLGGSPLSGVTLRASGMGPLYTTQESTTDGSGAYLLPIVETASYTITPELAGYTFSPPTLTGTMSTDLTQDFVATLITYNISGTVTVSGNPLAAATVDGGALGTQTTDSNGAYSFAGILPGTAYTLNVSHSGATFATSSASGTLNSHATHDFSGTLTSHTLSGTVTLSGSGLAGVTVNAGVLGSTTTDNNGQYSFTGVNYGTSYTITPSLTDYTFTPALSSGTLTGDTTLDFSATYNPPTTVSTSTVATTTTAPTITSAPTTTVEATSTTVPATTTAMTTSTAYATTSIASTSLPITTSALTTTTLGEATTTVPTSTSVATTTAPLDTDGDGLTDSEEEAIDTDPEIADSDEDGVTDGEEVTTGTNPKDPGSKAPKLRTTICSDWNGYLGGSTGRGMYNIIEHINLTAKKIRVKTELRSIRGHLKDTYEFFLRGNQQFDLLVHDMGGREPNSYGQVCTNYERAPAGSLDGRMVYYKYGDTGNIQSGDIQFAFALPFENPSISTSALLYNTLQPSLNPADSGNLVANWVQLSNVSKKRLKGRLYFHRPDGTQLTKPVDVNLRDGARYDYSAHGYGTSLTGLVRFVPRDKTVEYQLREVRYLYDNPGTEDSFASAYPFSAEVGSGETVIAPVDTTDSSAVLELGNMLATAVTANIKLYDSTGNALLYNKSHSLKAYGSEHIVLDTHLVAGKGIVVVKASAAKQSVASITATNPTGTKAAASTAGSLLGQVVHYSRKSNGSVQNLYAMPLREPTGTIMRGSYNTYLNQSCTLYLSNVASAKEKVTVSLKQGDGTSPVRDYKLTVPARGMLAEDICSKSPPDVYGVVTVTATKAKRIYGAVVRRGDAGRYKMGTVLR